MMNLFKQKISWLRAKGLVYITLVLILASSGLLPFLLTRSALAAGQLSVRSVQISSGVPSKAAVQYKFTFTVAATSTVQSLKIQFCQTAVGTCTGTAGTNIPNATSAAWVSQNSWQGAVNFAAGAGSNDCTASSSVICATRSSATNQTATARDITFGTITNPSAINTTFFARITTYSDAAYTLGNIQDTGTVATATVQTLTVSANVAEILNFCIGSTTINDATTALGTPDCTGVSGTSLSLGNLDPGHINISPVTATNGGDLKNGIALLRTNGTGTTTVSYDAIQSALGTGNLGALRINAASSTCTSSNTDPCINSIATQAQIVTGTEKFGMTIPGVNCGNGSGGTITYACSFSGGTNHLSRNAAYDGDGTLNATQFTNDIDQITGTSQNGYEWIESGTVTPIASASTVVDDEALILKFAASSNNITPFGAYSVQADFIAVPSY
jgi:hypothetical protein